jgi:hypothetical protein
VDNGAQDWSMKDRQHQKDGPGPNEEPADPTSAAVRLD